VARDDAGRQALFAGLNRSNCPRRWSSQGGALRGRSPCTREGRRPDRPELQWSGASGQWRGPRTDSGWA